MSVEVVVKMDKTSSAPDAPVRLPLVRAPSTYGSTAPCTPPAPVSRASQQMGPHHESDVNAPPPVKWGGHDQPGSKTPCPPGFKDENASNRNRDVSWEYTGDGYGNGGMVPVPKGAVRPPPRGPTADFIEMNNQAFQDQSVKAPIDGANGANGARDDFVPFRNPHEWNKARRNCGINHPYQLPEQLGENRNAANPNSFGTRIDQSHSNFETAYYMLTAIRHSVSRQGGHHYVHSRPNFNETIKEAFDSAGSQVTPAVEYDFKLKDYAPAVFSEVRKLFNVDAADYLMSLGNRYICSQVGSPGKSGSFFYFSEDYKYIIKTVSQSEHKYFRDILPKYFNYVKENPNTLLSQYYGMYRVKSRFGRKLHFVVMNNILPPHRDIHQTYDLKGSTVGRRLPESRLISNPQATMKDLNWMGRGMNINLGPKKQDSFMDQLVKDVGFLDRVNVMDYSLLIGIHDLRIGNTKELRNKTLSVFDPNEAVEPTPNVSSTGLSIPSVPDLFGSVGANTARRIFNAGRGLSGSDNRGSGRSQGKMSTTSSRYSDQGSAGRPRFGSQHVEPSRLYKPLSAHPWGQAQFNDSQRVEPQHPERRGINTHLPLHPWVRLHYTEDGVRKERTETEEIPKRYDKPPPWVKVEADGGWRCSPNIPQCLDPYLFESESTEDGEEGYIPQHLIDLCQAKRKLAHMNHRITDEAAEAMVKADAMRQNLRNRVPVPMSESSISLPEDNSWQRADKGQYTKFSAEEGGFHSTDQNNQPGNEIYYLGIIDGFTKWGKKKKIESIIKGFVHDKNEVSAVPPQEYGTRFINFIKNSLSSRPLSAIKE